MSGAPGDMASFGRRFEFSVKCHHALTHSIEPRPTEDAFGLLELMLTYCRILGSKLLVLQSPASAKLDQDFIDQARSFFCSSITDRAVKMAWEFRIKPDQMPEALVSLMRDFDMIHVVDLTFEDLCYESNTLYSCVFGSAAKQNILDIEDLKRLEEKMQNSNNESAYIVGHSLRMI
jgi:uncharacterized protein YecE (DUF72 family)